jgi:hypothetical protein
LLYDGIIYATIQKGENGLEQAMFSQMGSPEVN